MVVLGEKNRSFQSVPRLRIRQDLENFGENEKFDVLVKRERTIHGPFSQQIICFAPLIIGRTFWTPANNSNFFSFTSNNYFHFPFTTHFRVLENHFRNTTKKKWLWKFCFFTTNWFSYIHFFYTHPQNPPFILPHLIILSRYISTRKCFCRTTFISCLF